MANEGRARVEDCQWEGQKPIGSVNGQDVKFSIDDLEELRFVGRQNVLSLVLRPGTV